MKYYECEQEGFLLLRVEVGTYNNAYCRGNCQEECGVPNFFLLGNLFSIRASAEVFGTGLTYLGNAFGNSNDALTHFIRTISKELDRARNWVRIAYK